MPPPTVTNFLRPIFANFIFPAVKFVVPLAGALLGLVAAYFGARLWIRAAWSVPEGLISYLFTLQDVDTQYAENNFNLFGWVALFILIWSHDVRLASIRNLWIIGVMPLVYNCLKALVLYIAPIAHTLDPWSLAGWLHMMKDMNLLLLVTQFFAFGDLCAATLLLLYSLSLVRPPLTRPGISLDMVLCYMLNPIGVATFITWVGSTSIGSWFTIPTVVAIVAFIVVTGLGSAESMFAQLLSLAIGWAGLFFYVIAPKTRQFQHIAAGSFVAGVALPILNYFKVFFIYQMLGSSAPHPDMLSIFYSIKPWTILLRDPYILFASLAHIAITSLAIGFLIAAHFAKVYTFSDEVPGKIFILFTLVITAIFPPLGLLVYFVLCWFIPDSKQRGYVAPDSS